MSKTCKLRKARNREAAHQRAQQASVAELATTKERLNWETLSNRDVKNQLADLTAAVLARFGRTDQLLSPVHHITAYDRVRLSSFDAALYRATDMSAPNAAIPPRLRDSRITDYDLAMVEVRSSYRTERGEVELHVLVDHPNGSLSQRYGFAQKIGDLIHQAAYGV